MGLRFLKIAVVYLILGALLGLRRVLSRSLQAWRRGAVRGTAAAR